MEGTSRNERKTVRGQVSSGVNSQDTPKRPGIMDGLAAFTEFAQATHDWLQNQFGSWTTQQHNNSVLYANQIVDESQRMSAAEAGLSTLGWLTSLYGAYYPIGVTGRFPQLFTPPIYYTTQGLGTVIDGVQLFTDDGAYNTTKNAVGVAGGTANILGESNVLRLIPNWGKTADKVVDITGTASDWYNAVEQPIQWIAPAVQ